MSKTFTMKALTAMAEEDQAYSNAFVCLPVKNYCYATLGELNPVAANQTKMMTSIFGLEKQIPNANFRSGGCLGLPPSLQIKLKSQQ